MVRNHARKNEAQGAGGAGRNHRQAVDAIRRYAPGAGRTIVVPGDAVPRDETGFPECPLRRGDVLPISCPAGQARVVEIWGDGAVALIRWPWQKPTSRTTSRWTSRRRAPRGSPYRSATPPLARGVREGAILTVDLPPTVVHVAYTSDAWFADDRDAGRPPTPT